MVKVSVIIPTFNRATCLPRALESALAQSLSDIEIIICDDGSTDETCAIVEQYKKNDSRIRLLRQQGNLGSGAARNLGMSAATGEYIAFLDSDDYWLPEKLSHQIHLLDSSPPKVGLCMSGGTIEYENTQHVIHYLPKKHWEHDTLRKFVTGKIVFLTSTLIFRRSCLEHCGLMNEKMRRNQDIEFLVRILMRYNLVVLPETLATYRFERRSGQYYKTLANIFPIHMSHYEYIRDNLGWWTAIRYKSFRCIDVLSWAIRDGEWAGVLKWSIRRLKVIPFLFPNEILELTKALLRTALQKWEKHFQKSAYK